MSVTVAEVADVVYFARLMIDAETSLSMPELVSLWTDPPDEASLRIALRRSLASVNYDVAIAIEDASVMRRQKYRQSVPPLK
jgi:hypothetical protein